MIQNSKVIRENEFTSHEKIILLKIVTTLKKLGEDGDVLKEAFARAGREPEQMLTGLSEQLATLQNSYAEESYGYEALQALIDEMEGDAENAERKI